MLFKIKYNHPLTSTESLYERYDTSLNTQLVNTLICQPLYCSSILSSREMKIIKDRNTTRQS